MDIKRLIERLFDYFRTPGCTITRSHRAAIAYNPRHPIFLREYYLYCVELFKLRLVQADAAINLTLGDYAVDFDNEHATKKIDLQFEHTLVKPGGRDSEGAMPGTVALRDGSGHYLVRIQNYEYLRILDLIIDYSQANMANVRNSGRFDAYLSKTICIAPLLYEVDFGSEREGGIITLFSDTEQSRRKRFLALARASNLKVSNVRRTFDRRQLKSLYRHTRILINIHQTDDHHTFEELRVLPALLCGVIVISEDVPLKEHIPYSRFIVWSSYEGIIDAAKSVLDDYAHRHRQLFGGPELAEILQRMQSDNIRNIDSALSRLAGSTHSMPP